MRALRSSGRRVVRAGAMATARTRRGPDLVIIGVKRGGTTSLFRDLEHHPSMVPLVPSAARLPLRENQKGVHYFDAGVHRSDRWYRSHFATQRTLAARRAATGHAFTAEASPYYLFHPLAAARAAAALPHAQFVVLLRDPVDRTVSQWAEQTRNGIETLDLRSALDAEADRLGDDAQRLASGSLARSFAHEHQSYAAQSEYAPSLRRWRDAVGPARLTIRYSEDYWGAPAEIASEVLEAIGVPPDPDPPASHRNAAPREPLDGAIEERLVDRFAPDVERVREIVGVAPPWPRFGLRAPRTTDRLQHDASDADA